MKGKLKTLLGELWENGVFDTYSFRLLEKIVTYLAEKENYLNETHLEKFKDELLFELSTIRNRNLISYENQKKLTSAVVGFFGLSVGSHAAITWVIESRAQIIKIIDPDIIEASNLNRLRFGWESLGRRKIDVVKEALESINPGIQIVSSLDTEPERVIGLFDSSPEIDVVVDAIDDMEAKILLRKLSKERKIPVVSAADVGDNVVCDVERYDLDPKLEIFLGRIPGIDRIDFKSLSDLERKKLIIRLVGFEENSEDLLRSLQQLGKSLGTWPQLGATATIAGGMVTTIIKKILMGEEVNSGRYYLSLDTILVPTFKDGNRVVERQDTIQKIRNDFKFNE